MEDQNNKIKGSFNAVKVDDAEEMTAKWQQLTDADGNHYPKSFMFSKFDFVQILNEDWIDASHIKIYPAMKEDGTITLLAVGVDKYGDGDNDSIDLINPIPDAEKSGIFDFALPCPKTCGESPLYVDRSEE